MIPGELDSSALKGSVAFTGRLACMSRAEAFEVVRQHSGTPSQAVTKRTNLLIVGELGWPLLDDGRPSNKLAQANSYSVPVVSERRFLEWIGKAVPEAVQKTYSGERLAALSKLSSTTIQELVHSDYWMSEVAVSGFATWQARVRSQNYSRTEFDCRKLFEA
jgi:BRCT domain type II-containing protein